MSIPTLDFVRAAAIERELAAVGTPASQLQRRQRKTRAISITIGSLALTGALTGAAIIVSGLPGATTTSPLGDPVSGSYVGTANVEIGPVPAESEVVILDVTCTEGGTITVPLAGPGNPTVIWDCSDPIRSDTVHIADGLLPSPGTTYITITADPGTEWAVTARYGSSVTTEWAVNSAGQTYGVPNDNGTPDLVAAQATNGAQGYILDVEMAELDGEGFINVYESDGTTVIGKFPIGDVQD